MNLGPDMYKSTSHWAQWCMSQQLFIVLPWAREKQEIAVDVYFPLKTQVGEPFQTIDTERFLVLNSLKANNSLGTSFFQFSGS